MAVQFTTYLIHNGKEICLYIRQDNDSVDKLCVTVHVQHRSAVFYLCREGADQWKATSKYVPHWVREIMPILTSQLEQKYFR